MSRYGDNELDDMSYEIEDFLKTHSISQLLELVTYIIKIKEEEYGR